MWKRKNVTQLTSNSHTQHMHGYSFFYTVVWKEEVETRFFFIIIMFILLFSARIQCFPSVFFIHLLYNFSSNYIMEIFIFNGDISMLIILVACLFKSSFFFRMLQCVMSRGAQCHGGHFAPERTKRRKQATNASSICPIVNNKVLMMKYIISIISRHFCHNIPQWGPPVRLLAWNREQQSVTRLHVPCKLCLGPFRIISVILYLTPNFLSRWKF